MRTTKYDDPKGPVVLLLLLHVTRQLALLRKAGAIVFSRPRERTFVSHGESMLSVFSLDGRRSKLRYDQVCFLL